MAVVGAGVVGLAVAAEIAARGREALVIERRRGSGRETSSRNSQVIHAGLYYEPGSLKARLCVRGNRLLYRFCEERGVSFRRIGKLVVSSDEEQVAELERIARRGEDNGAEGLELLDAADVTRLEPKVRARAALLSPSTGVVDAHGLVKALEARLTAAGGWIQHRCELIGVEADRSGFTLRVRDPAGEETVRARALVNAAGLDADRVARLAGIDRYRLHWCKGDYFSVAGAASRSVARLIYPTPSGRSAWLGIHVTLDLGGRMILGPDSTYIERTAEPGYGVDEDKAETFRASVARFLPAIASAELSPDFSGIRPKLQAPGEPPVDFVIEQEPEIPGLINLVGIESPGLTSALAIGEHVAEMVAEML